MKLSLRYSLNPPSLVLSSFLFLVSLTAIFPTGLPLSPDGLALLSLKSSTSANSFFSQWNPNETTPCTWAGISCSTTTSRVIAVSLPALNLTGPIPRELKTLTSLRRLNLHTNRLTGPISPDLFNSLTSLQILLLHGNYLSGAIPSELILRCRRLQRLVLARNRFSGEIPRGVWSRAGELAEIDFSGNELTGEIPMDLGELVKAGSLNLSFNRLTGRVPNSLGNLPAKVRLDLRGNNFSGEVPRVGSLEGQDPTAFLGNPLLCGSTLRRSCDGSSDDESAETALEEDSNTHASTTSSSSSKRKGRLDPNTVVLISAADAAAVAFVGVIIIYFYWKNKKGVGCCVTNGCSCTGIAKLGRGQDDDGDDDKSSKSLLFCFNRASATRSNADSGSDDAESFPEKSSLGELVALEKSFSIEMDELLRASAYVLGKSGVGIVYKVVLGSGIPVAVRRLGEGGGGGGVGEGDQQKKKRCYKEFVAEVNAIAKVKHPNVVRLRAYYWTSEEKLLISDFIDNGNLATALRGQSTTTSSNNLCWSIRIRIAKGTAKGLAYLHEHSHSPIRKSSSVHGDIKPSNILLDTNFNPFISDFGLNTLINITGTDPYSSSGGGLMGGSLPYIKPPHRPPRQAYKAPEVRLPGQTQPTQKSDVYSFGVVLLELLTGKYPEELISSEVNGQGVDLVKWVRRGFEEEIPLAKMVDPALLTEVHAKKEVLAVFHVALACTEGDPEVRPRMKQVAEKLEKVGT